MPPAIGAVLARARAHHPTDRFPTMRAFLEALDEAVAASKVGTPPAKGAPADRRGRLRSLSFLGVSTAILLAACAFLHRTGALAGSTNTAMGVAVDHAPRSPSESLAQGESLPSERLEAPERVFLSRDVQAAFQRGLQLWRDASTDAAREQFELAARLDPSLATAHLHYVMVSELVEPSVRDHLRQAIALRGTLTKSEARLLDALIPAVLDANQQDETLDRLARLANTSPHDGDLQMVLALHLVHAHRLPSALGLARPWAIQSANALPHFVAARCLAEMDDADGLHQQLASCLDRAPSSGDCLEMSIRLALNDGQCTEAEALSRRFIAASPQASLPYLFLAEALAGEGRAPDEVRAPLEQRWFRDGDAVRSLHRCRDEGLVEILRGDFRRADEALESCTKAEVTQVDSYAQGIPRWLRAEVAREVGDVSKAQRLAREFVAASAAWSPNEVYESRMEGWQLLRKAGAMSADEFDKLRTTWLSQPLSADHYYSRPGVRWFEAYACTAMTNEEARLALAELPAEKPLFPVHFREPHVDATLGEMFLRAGVHAEARAHLERSAKSCSVFSYLKIAQAQDQLGTLYETLGQPDEACASYKSILARWGPESGSRHARHASARWKALGCSSRSN
jgi:tetratricopeptide (TPR) repeat protein